MVSPLTGRPSTKRSHTRSHRATLRPQVDSHDGKEALFLVIASDQRERGNLPWLCKALTGVCRKKPFLLSLGPTSWYTRSSHAVRRHVRSLGVTDKHDYAQCSRFITDNVMETMDKLAVGAEPVPTDAPAQISPSEDIASRIRDLWK